MMRQWERDHRRAQQFLPHIRQICAQVFMTEAPMHMDMKENTDMLVELQGNRIAIRVRTMEGYESYNRRNEWTIRTSRPSGIQTELEKILYGWGDYYFYGWGDDTDKRIKAYTIIDLKPARPWLYREGPRLEQQHGQKQRNKDGSSAFIAICLDDLPTSCIIARRGAPEIDTPFGHTPAPRQTSEQQHHLDTHMTLAERYAHLSNNDRLQQQQFEFRKKP